MLLVNSDSIVLASLGGKRDKAARLPDPEAKTSEQSYAGRVQQDAIAVDNGVSCCRGGGQLRVAVVGEVRVLVFHRVHINNAQLA